MRSTLLVAVTLLLAHRAFGDLEEGRTESLAPMARPGSHGFFPDGRPADPVGTRQQRQMESRGAGSGGIDADRMGSAHFDHDRD